MLDIRLIQKLQSSSWVFKEIAYRNQSIYGVQLTVSLNEQDELWNRNGAESIAVEKFLNPKIKPDRNRESNLVISSMVLLCCSTFTD